MGKASRAARISGMFAFAVAAGGTLPISQAEAGPCDDPTNACVITNVQGLEDINDDLSGDYILGSNIDASSTASWNSGQGFIPIGNINSPFTGIFNGNGHAIDGLTSSYHPVFYSGWFGQVGASGVIENVGVTNANIATGFNVGEGGGVLVGFNVGTVSNSYATGTINGGTYGSNVGGLVGSNQGLVSQSNANVALSGNGLFSYGGLIGYNYPTGTISQSFSTGSVTFGGNADGGLAGLNSGAIRQSYSTPP